MDAQANALIEKERGATKRVQAACEQEWAKLNKVEHEKYVVPNLAGYLTGSSQNYLQFS